MKRAAATFLMLLFTILLSRSIFAQTPVNKTADSLIILKDGTYTGTSRAKYKYEPFWGTVMLTIKNNQFSEIKFGIRDSSLHENFDGNYEKHFVGNEVYTQQSRNDWKGVKAYPAKLSGKNNINEVDAISGATWSYNIFKASVEDALKNAR